MYKAYQIPEPFPSSDRHNFEVVQCYRNGIQTVWECQIRAVYAARWLADNLGNVAELVKYINNAIETPYELPLGLPSITMWQCSPGQSHISGDVLNIRAKWPNERELAL